jgi:hypothetical protein
LAYLHDQAADGIVQVGVEIAMTTNRYQLKAGDRVEITGKPNKQGTITGFDAAAHHILVRWDGSSFDREEYEDNILPIGQSKIQATLAQSKIVEAANALEAAYQLWQEAKEALPYGGVYVFEEAKLIDTRPLEVAAEEWGWSSSSLYC